MTAPTRVHVAGPAPYDVVVGRGLLEELPGLVGAATRVGLVFDGAVPDLTARVRTVLEGAGYTVVGIELSPAGEAAKSYPVLESCWERLGAAGFTRSDAIVTLGGGATTDLGGFVAATWLRGVRVVHVPTSLLAMVDAAVGGKTGINTGAGKNLVGAFHEPAGVLCDLAALDTLPRAELVSGMAEVIKCGFVGDPEILRVVEADPALALDPASPELAELVRRAVAFKADVVAADLRKSGRREVLNYGHTFGHAVEASSGYAVRHGEAVALGMVYVAELARLAGRLDERTAARHASTLALVGLPVRLSDPALAGGELAGAPFGELLDRMRVDKKARGTTIRFVVLDGLAMSGRLAGPDEELLVRAYGALS